ncbi:MAG: hypothetical protein ACYCPT_09335 [Acidimicrobiales bacterium]
MKDQSQVTPVKYLSVGDRDYWRYQDRWYTDSDFLESEGVKALIVTREMRLDKKLSEAKTVASARRLPDGAHSVLPADLRPIQSQLESHGSVRRTGPSTKMISF